ncbi:MAG: GNAT family N-acetyltransferase [Clostridia bacterium]|nr:GNAT family N-acetyltransferase [Clostridia bacterium]
MDTVFTSQRIRFVSVSESLIADYLAMINDQEHVARFLGLSRSAEPLSEQKERQWVQKKLAENAPVFSMLEKQTGAFIGNMEFIGITDGVAELGIAITADMQDKGFGTEAIPALVRYGVDRLGLHRVFLRVRPFNARAIHVYEKCGFQEYDRNETSVFMEIIK